MSLTAMTGTSSFRPACITSSLVLAMLSIAIAEDPTEQQQREAYEAKRKELYESYGREALENRNLIGYGTSDYVSVFPIQDLSKELKVKAGEISLLPDPKDRGSGKIAVYLLNATDKPLPRAIAFRLDCFMEVKDGDRWRPCESFIPGCGTGKFEPLPLEANHGLVFTATDPGFGDMTGELRYCVTIRGSRPIVSTSFQGRFSSKKFEAANPPGGMGGSGIQRGLDGGGWSDPRDGEHGSIGRSPEEWLAVAELDRHHNESLLTRTMLVRWAASSASGKDMGRCRAAAARLSKQPWDRYSDVSSLFHRCLAAVTGKSGKEAEFGTPEHCRSVVWRYLNVFRYRSPDLYINPERWEQWEAIEKSGNPWGVDQKLVATVVQEAVASLNAADADEREAAGTFLQAGWITSEHLPDDRWWTVLDHDVNSARFAAVSALKQRGKQKEVRKWLVDHRETPGLQLRGLWTTLADRESDFADWELPIALRLLETSPLEASGALSSRCRRLQDPALKPLPAELKEPLRKFLSDEAAAKRLAGMPPPKEGEEPYSASRISDPRDRHSQLTEAITVLGAWDDPTDIPLFQKFLDHPLAVYSCSKDGITRVFVIRQLAAGLLKRRQEEVPKDIVFEERVQPSE